MIVDSHAHYDDEQFDTDRDEVLNSIRQQGVVRVVNPSSNLESARKCIELSEKYDILYCAVGIHPHDANEFSKNALESVRKLASFKKVVAIGEIGLDYHYNFSPPELQKECFAAHIQLALELKLPVIIHDREAHRDTLDIIRAERGYMAGGVFHCFSGSVEMAKEVLDLGFYIALGGAVTFKNAKKPVEVAGYVPLDRLLVETDSPYMAPVPYRGKRNNSGYLHEIIRKISEIRNEDFDVIAETTAKNANILFGLGL
ncbi:hydrolase TatD [Thermoclostridium stercorarium subsp. leptospartum DSM 9219]|jgi:TatD DNase family protein|uniref:Hydrolase TatD n=1 Tax=Thermoclostridium stercorarium subsp. leptospartum DSM 9219 TaxID=1346611 RepID=A0A1B1YN25_THEST|nr:TatD family hydrolase [Thermoclostridium stercorarium]ANX02158.1 hydrolase TatD [Thermoclostridium stercorarium subsp. leptospartum DSM 9219]